MNRGASRTTRGALSPSVRRAIWIVVLLAAQAASCKKPKVGVDGGTHEEDASTKPVRSAPPPPEGVLLDLWLRAKSGGDDDLIRLARREGVETLFDRTLDPAWRQTALRALGHTEDLSAVGEIAAIARGGEEDDAILATEAVRTIFATRRRQVDPEFAASLREGCAQLAALANDGTRSRKLRALAVSALRQGADTGCLAREALPDDVDSR